MRERSIVRMVLGILVLLWCISPAAAAGTAGEKAPGFDLPFLTGDGFRGSGELFRTHRSVFLVFWESHCPRCVEALAGCEEFHLEYGGEDIAVVGLNGDEENTLRVRGLLSAGAITFTQLWDRGGEVARAYGVPLDVFTICLVGDDGVIIGRAEDPRGNIKGIMEGMMIGGTVAAPVPVPGDVHGESVPETQPDGEGGISPVRGTTARAAGEAGFAFRGSQRLRFLSTDSRGDGAVGPYGEEVRSRNNLLLRFELEVTRRLGRYVTLGGLLRVSNEGRDVLRSGPQYFDSEWGSAFVEIAVKRFMLRFGYYPIHLTPLTLMRWDWDDNPRTGGDAGCGCGAAAGVLLLESLEELGPDLFFEGGTAHYSRGDFAVRAFYAIPRRAVESTAMEVGFGGAEPTAYSLEIYGGDIRWQRYDTRTGSFWRAGVHFVGSWENRRSVDFLALGYGLAPPWYESSILSASAEAPLLRWTSLVGEWIVANRACGHGFIEPGVDFIKLKGGGGTAGLLLEQPRWVRLRFDYLRLDDEFYAPFSALSYEPNREGWRVSSRITLPGEFSAVSLFYKSLEAVELDEGTEKLTFFGASFDIDLDSGPGASLGWLDRGNWTEDNGTEPLDITRRALTGSLRYRFDRNMYVQAQYQRVESSGYETVAGIGERRDIDTLTHLYSVYWLANF
ncbi:MAG TPA: TlpA disulfide reductase family protein [Patescibacteria group bacterium]|nr:TlpA disulfide reductase family protein [Patescibacteria group bacterium]